MTPKHRERRGSRGFKLTNGDLHLLAMATEGERTDGREGVRGADSTRSSNEAVTARRRTPTDDVRYVSAEGEA